MTYALDNDDELAAMHHMLLSDLWDSYSERRSQELINLRGKRCLEVGAGVGASFALWLAAQVGNDGFVMATDIKPREIPRHARLAVVTDDITTGAPYSDGGWDFIHARLVLGHILERRQVVRKLITVLNPGGAILIEDFSPMTENTVMCAPTVEAVQLYNRVQTVMTREVDPAWAPQIHGTLRDEGLIGVHTDIHSEAWPGGSDGCKLVATTIDQLRPQLIAAGPLTAADLDRTKKLLNDPDFVLAGHLMFSTSGHKPE